MSDTGKRRDGYPSVPAADDPDIFLFEGERLHHSPKLLTRFASWLRERRRDDRR